MIIESLRVIAGLVLILFIPGYALTWAFFPKRIDITDSERIAYSFALSISGVMLSVLFADIVLGVDTTPVNIIITILALTFIAILIWKIQLHIIDKDLKQKSIKGFFVSVKQFKERINDLKYVKRQTK